MDRKVQLRSMTGTTTGLVPDQSMGGVGLVSIGERGILVVGMGMPRIR